jgi:hypothetical protein
MLNIDLDSRLEAKLVQVAQQAHKSPEDIIKTLITQYLDTKTADELLADVAQYLPPIACFAHQAPLTIQENMRHEWC